LNLSFDDLAGCPKGPLRLKPFEGCEKKPSKMDIFGDFVELKLDKMGSGKSREGSEGLFKETIGAESEETKKTGAERGLDGVMYDESLYS
jgi:hypothetical protein